MEDDFTPAVRAHINDVAAQTVDFVLLAAILRAMPDGREVFEAARDRLAETAASRPFAEGLADAVAKRLGDYAQALDR